MEFATKPELARQMVARAIEAGVPFSWVAADEAYGQNGTLRDWLQEHDVRYVLAVPRSFTVATGRWPDARGRACRPGARRGLAASVVRQRVQGAALWTTFRDTPAA